jgi:undecaprenyl-diphosphatase
VHHRMYWFVAYRVVVGVVVMALLGTGEVAPT